MLQGVVQNFNDFEKSVTHGDAMLNKFTIDEQTSKFTQLRAMFNRREWDYCPSGNYIQLFVKGVMMMSDTRMERITNRDFIYNAHGDVFIAGLGVGLILHNLKEKVEKGEVTSITVIEISQDVIDLVSKYYSDMNIKYICGDVLEYKPKKDEKYDTIYFDIWPVVCEENLDDMRKLSYIWRSHKKTKESWVGYWAREQALKLRREY